MTPDWFRDLAERCKEAARYAAEFDEPSMARELYLAQQDAEDLAYSIEKDLARFSEHATKSERAS
jgi:hypothetical protein